MKQLKLLSALLALSFPLTLWASGLHLNPLPDGGLEIIANFELQGASLPQIYTAGSPVGEQVAIIVEGRAADLRLELVEQKLAGKKLTSELARVPLYPCRCPEDALGPKEALPLTDLKGVEVQELGDFRKKILTKILLRSVSLKENVAQNFKSRTFKLTRTDGSAVRTFTSDDLHLPDSLLIVTPERWMSAVEELAQLERAQGVQVQVRTLEELGPTFWDLKRALKAQYEKYQFGHILFVGDEDRFPTELVQTSTDFQTPSDLQYFLMGAANDRLPDVMGARLAVKEVDQIEIYTQKLRDYYAKVAPKHAVMIASDEGSAPSDVEYIRQMAAPLAQKYNLSISEVLQNDPTTSPEYLVLKLETGAAWLNYIGHGSGYSWSSVNEAEFDLNHVQSLSASATPFIAIDVACQNGRFKDDGRLGMEFIFHHDSGQSAGAVAFYGGSVDISWHPPAVMAVAINQDVAQRPESSLGEHLLRGQFELIENYDDLESALENLVWYHLQGVPTIRAKF